MHYAILRLSSHNMVAVDALQGSIVLKYVGFNSPAKTVIDNDLKPVHDLTQNPRWNIDEMSLWPGDAGRVDAYRQQLDSHFMGFSWSGGPAKSVDTYLSLSLPYWFLTLVFALLPTIWLIKWRRRRNLPDNPCPSCGYDLTGNESGECPECGQASETEATEA